MDPEKDATCRNCEDDVDGKRFHCVLCSFDLCGPCAGKTKQTIDTDCFLRLVEFSTNFLNNIIYFKFRIFGYFYI